LSQLSNEHCYQQFGFSLLSTIRDQLALRYSGPQSADPFGRDKNVCYLLLYLTTKCFWRFQNVFENFLRDNCPVSSQVAGLGWFTRDGVFEMQSTALLHFGQSY